MTKKILCTLLFSIFLVGLASVLQARSYFRAENSPPVAATSQENTKELQTQKPPLSILKKAVLDRLRSSLAENRMVITHVSTFWLRFERKVDNTWVYTGKLVHTIRSLEDGSSALISCGLIVVTKGTSFIVSFVNVRRLR